VVEYPPEEEFPQDRPLRGRGGIQYVKTLPTFSLEGRTAVVTGGARGLGLVMGQALVQSGADLAIVDLNSKPPTFSYTALWNFGGDVLTLLYRRGGREAGSGIDVARSEGEPRRRL
jgi:NAD(P)-dependent dehydrogenase (short-subunit alcohol dehydrogenase family)